MSARLLVATRKGLFEYRREKNGNWCIVRRSFVGEPVSMVLQHKGSLYAALNLGHFGCKLHRSDNDGESWQEVAVPVYPQADESASTSDAAGESEEPDSHPDKNTEPDKSSDPDKISGPSLSLIWSLEAAGDRLWAGTIPGGLFCSDDKGESWQLNESLWQEPSREQWFGGGYDKPGIHSICIDPTDSSRITVGISCGGVWTSADEGQSWQTICKGMFAEYMPPEQRENPTIQDPHRLVQCAASPQHLWVQHHNGIFKSKDYGANWQVVTAEPSSFGFAVAVHPNQPETAWFVPAIKDEFRVPVDGKLVVTRTEDGGASFTALDQGLPEEESYDLIYRHGLDVDASGERLAMGSTTGNLWLSENGGENWALLSGYLPPVYALRFV